MEFQENISLAKHTSFKIGGPARYFFIAKNKEELIEAVKQAKNFNLKFFILGGGSNVLALDQGYDGLVVKVNLRKYYFNNDLYAEAGVSWGELVGAATEKSLTGLEWTAGLPGVVGGAVYGNVQAFHVRISDIVKEVEAFNPEDLSIKSFSRKDCQFSEKDSVFKKNKSLIILSAVLEIKKGDKKEIEKKIKEHLQFRKEKQPLGYASAGSVFINVSDKPSSYLIDKAGLKGLKIGQAQVSEKHAGFIINLGGAKSKDVLELIRIIKEKVKEKFNVDIQEEIQIIK